KTAQIGRVPLASRRISKIYKRHARLPQIPLPDVAVRTFHEIAVPPPFLEQSGALRDVRVNPYADLQPFVLEPLQHADRVREHPLVPLEVRPMEFTHPEAVEVEHVQRQIPFRH